MMITLDIVKEIVPSLRVVMTMTTINNARVLAETVEIEVAMMMIETMTEEARGMMFVVVLNVRSLLEETMMTMKKGWMFDDPELRMAVLLRIMNNALHANMTMMKVPHLM